MPIVEMPDGTEIEFPDTMSGDEIKNVLRQKYKPTQGQPKQSELGGMFDAFTQGATFGFGDELTGAEAALLGRTPEGGWFDYSGTMQDRYKAARDAERAQQEAYSEQSPVLSTTANIAGAIASPVNKVIAPMMSAPTLAGRIGRGAGFGAGLGAVSGAGEAETMADIPAEMASGAALGGAVGGIAPAAIEGAVKTASPVINAFLDRLPFRQRSAAARRVAQAIQDEGLTPEQAISKVREMGPRAALMDIGENLQGQARAVQSIPGEGKARLSEFLAQRQEGLEDVATGLQRGGQYERVSNIVDELNPAQYGQAKQDVLDARKMFGKDYQEASRGALDDLVDIGPMMNDLDQGIMQAKGGVKTALEKVRALLVDAKGRPEIDIDSLHQAKMAIDDMMTGEARTSMGNVAKAKIRKYQDQLVNAIEQSGEAGKAYRQGRLGTAGQWRIDEALDMGRDYLSGAKFKDANEVRQFIKNMKPEELEAFQTGIVQKMREQMAGTRYTANSMKELIGKTGTEAKLEAAFGAQRFKQFKEALKKEAQMYETYNKVRGGSPTARIEAEQAGIMQDPGRLAQGFRGLVSGDMAQALRGAVDIGGSVLDRVQLPKGVSREMADILSGRGDLSALQQQSIRMQQFQTAKDRLARQAILAALAGGQ